MSGWIAIHRSLTNHWLYPVDRPFTKLEAWIDLLMMVNWTKKTVCLGAETIECERGEIVTSQLKLMKRWGWSKSKLINYQNILQKDRMIVVKSDSKKTTIKILKYEDYQDVIEICKIKKTAEKTAERPDNVPKKDRKPYTTKQYNKEELNIEILWKTDFEKYKADCMEAFTKFSTDQKFLTEQSQFYSKLDIVKTMWNAHRSYWDDEKAWNHLKKQSTKKINWKLTIINAIKYKPNWIYLEGAFNKPKPVKSTRLPF